MKKPETVTVQVYLRVPVMCRVEVGPANEEGQHDIFGIDLATRGNMEPESIIDSAGLDESEYDDIDAAAAKEWAKR